MKTKQTKKKMEQVEFPLVRLRKGQRITFEHFIKKESPNGKVVEEFYPAIIVLIKNSIAFVPFEWFLVIYREKHPEDKIAKELLKCVQERFKITWGVTMPSVLIKQIIKEEAMERKKKKPKKNNK